jgi:4-amino-4-deoxy-L-arabinose transferase-like glycosyltransferase
VPPIGAWIVAGVGAVLVEFYRLGVATWNRDEWVYANAGYDYLSGSGHHNLEHPPFAKLLIGVSEHLFGFSTTSARIPAASAAILTGVALALIARRLVGSWVAFSVFALWICLPHPVAGLRIDRFALLDCFAASLAAWAVWLALRLVDRPSPHRAVLVGGVAGLAAAAKLPGGLVLVAVVAYLLVERVKARYLLVTVAAAPVAFLLTYLPLRVDPVSTLRFMWRFQQHESTIGFPLVVAGRVFQHPPWWTPFWFAWHAAPSLSVVIVISAVIGLLAVPRRVGLLLGLWLVVPIIVVIAGHGRYFEHYAEIWQPQLVLVATLGLARLARLASWWRWFGVVLVAPMLVYGAVSVVSIATLQRGDYALVGDLLRTTTATSVDVSGAPTSLIGYLCPGVQVITAGPRNHAGVYDAIVVDPASGVTRAQRWQPDELVRAPQRFVRHEVGGLWVYLRVGITPQPSVVCRARS